MEPKENRSKLQKWAAAQSERSWRVVQTVSGIVLGAVICFFLYGDADGGSTYSIYALLLALIVPRLLEQACGRSVAAGRVVMLITLVLLIVGRLLMTLVLA